MTERNTQDARDSPAFGYAHEKEILEFFGLKCRTTLFKWRRRLDDPLPAIKVGGKIMYNWRHVVSWADRHRETANDGEDGEMTEWNTQDAPIVRSSVNWPCHLCGLDERRQVFIDCEGAAIAICRECIVRMLELLDANGKEER